MNRGDIWVIDLGGKAGRRPAVILTRQNVLEYLHKVSVAEVTTKGKGYPTEVCIGQKANLSKPSFIQTDTIHTVGKHRLVKYFNKGICQGSAKTHRLCLGVSSSST